SAVEASEAAASVEEVSVVVPAEAAAQAGEKRYVPKKNPAFLKNAGFFTFVRSLNIP
ncbi:MAG: hypothetical protein PWQ68_2255, partial [Thermoanaerobacteraceae bacterium]|nr:hypothetical protein [Thermoanaerobacteraceae bacterium]